MCEHITFSLSPLGMGTMIAIDYTNGDSILVDGLQSTLMELGIQKERSILSVSESKVLSTSDECESDSDDIAYKYNSNKEEVTDSTSASKTTPITTSLAEEKLESESDKEVIETKTVKPKKDPMLADVRDRMRQEAEEEAQNPWINMASYLAKKAFGSD